MSSNHSAERLTAAAVTANANHTGVQQFGGFAIKESAATAAVATVNLRQGVVAANNTGALLFPLELAANESAAITFTHPIEADPTYGVYVEVVVGTVSGVLYEWG